MADALTAIPEIVGHLIKITRIIQDFRGIDESLKSDFLHVQHIGSQVNAIVGIVNKKDYERTMGTQINISLATTQKAADDLTKKLEKVMREMGINIDKLTIKETSDSKLSDSVDTTYTLEAGAAIDGYLEIECGTPAFLAWLRFMKGWRWPGRRRKLDVISEKNALPADPVSTLTGVVQKTFNSGMYLAFGAPEIESLVKRLEKSLEDLVRYVMLAPLCSRVVCSDKVRAFLEKARSRISTGVELETLKVPPSYLTPLFVSESWTQSLYIITHGELKGHVIDRRDVGYQWKNGLIEEALDDSRRIARLLLSDAQLSDGITSQGFGLMRCRGVSFPDEEHHDLILQPPCDTGIPRTLRQLMLDTDSSNHLRSARIELSVQLCTAVHVVHEMGVVHKSIRPESILIFPSLGATRATKRSPFLERLGTPYLAGFCYSRSAVTVSQKNSFFLFDLRMADIIYHHPRHAGLSRIIAYQTEDDIYSLGICLLEIGLWESLLQWNSEAGMYLIDESWGVGEDEEKYPDSDNGSAFYARRDELIRIAEERLPVAMGAVYADAVLTCLKFRELQEIESEVEMEHKLDFIADVIAKLYQIKF